MKKEITARGFALYTFHESSGEQCSLQKSSAAEEDYIWLGFDKINLKTFTPYGIPSSWKEYHDEDLSKIFRCDTVVANTRMHLSRKQVKKLIPLLQKFVDTGEI